MADEGSGQTMVDGSIDWSGGVDSILVPTIQSQNNPNGIARNILPWLVNGTVRDGGITQRTGWQPLGTITKTGLYQGGILYDAISAFPYLIVCISGQTYKVTIPAAGTTMPLSPVNLTTGATLMPATQPQYFLVQGEQFAIIQAGDAVTLPIFWDGNVLRRSIGINNTAVAPGTPGVNEIPAATAMDYYEGRIWYAQGRQYSAGDIVGGQSGTLAQGFRDSTLEVTENPLVLGGDGFTVPSQAGNIRALFHNANLNTSLGQGQLFIGTRRSVYSLDVPVTRADWISSTNNSQPLQKVVQEVNGPVNDRSVTKANGDVFYQTLQPAVQSLFTAIRYFSQWANPPISSNMERVLAFNDRAVMNYVSGMVFDNRMWQTALPMATPQGVIHQAVMAMDFTPLSTFGQDLAPVWHGIYQGLNILQLFVGDFGGLERAFAVVVQDDNSIGLWELTSDNRFENGDSRVTWVIEFPAFTWGSEFLLKRLASAELWIDKIFGTVNFEMDYRPDGSPCWNEWFKWKLCNARSTCEDVTNPVCYPVKGFREGYRETITLPKPKPVCVQNSRPSDIGYQFQTRLTIHGWCRIRGLHLHAMPVERKLYQNLVC